MEQGKDQKVPGQNKTLAEGTTEPVADTIHDIATEIQTGLTVSVGGPVPNAAHGTDKEAVEDLVNLLLLVTKTRRLRRNWIKLILPKRNMG
ncbi:hypothetical protein SLA2020_120220 [Shorea laevis]